MNPAGFVKKFLLIFVFFGLAGFSFDAYSADAYYASGYSGRGLGCSGNQPCLAGGSIPATGQRFSSVAAICAYAPDHVVSATTGQVLSASYRCDSSGGWSISYNTQNYRSFNINVIRDYFGDFNDDCLASPDSPYCVAYCSQTPTPADCLGEDPDPEPDPEPLEPDDPYCIDDPMNPLCSPEEPSPMECENGVGSEACCASYAYKSCQPDSVGWWSPGYGLGGYVTSCSYSCQRPADPSEPDPYDPPEPGVTDPTMPPPVSPGDPSNPSVPSDPDDPVSVDLSGVNERLDILTSLNTDGFNMLGHGLDKLDRNTQVGLDNVRRSIDSGFSDLGRRLDPSNSPSFNPNAFDGLGGFTGADGDEMKGLLGITGDESFSDLERTITLEDYTDDYTFTLPDSSCPAPRQIALSFGTFELSYDPICEIFDYAGIFVILTALFLTPIIVFRGL